MSDLAARLQTMEDVAAIERVLLAYYAAVDTLHDLDALVACFTPDAVFDVSGLGLGTFAGHAAIRGFFAGAFADTAHHAHHVGNFRVSRLEGDAARAHGSVFAVAEGRDGRRLSVHCRYDIDLVRTAGGWKMRRFDEFAAMPLDGAVSDLHATARER